MYEFSKSVIVNAPIAEVWRVFIDLDAQKVWQDEFTGYTPVSGVTGEIGSVTACHYAFGKKSTDVEAKILERREFERILVECKDELGHVSLSRTEFEAIDYDCTRLTVTQSTDLDRVSIFKRPFQKSMMKLMTNVTVSRFADYVAEEFQSGEWVV